ncbi:MAG: hypothetical protein IIZ39_08535, partial [Blautia sp.]|nr:hypothetical protein [Blautia sp.]
MSAVRTLPHKAENVSPIISTFGKPCQAKPPRPRGLPKKKNKWPKTGIIKQFLPKEEKGKKEQKRQKRHRQIKTPWNPSP